MSPELELIVRAILEWTATHPEPPETAGHPAVSAVPEVPHNEVERYQAAVNRLGPRRTREEERALPF